MRNEIIAKVWDEEIVPLWSEPFGRLLMKGLEAPARANVLDLGCGTGYPALALFERLPQGSRIIAVDESGAMLDVARARAGTLAGKRIFFKVENHSKLSFANSIFDLAISNVCVMDSNDPQRLLSEVLRVLKPGGQFSFSVPLRGTLIEFYDLFRESLIVFAPEGALERLEKLIAQDHIPESMAQLVQDQGYSDVTVQVGRFHLLFRSSREFLLSPLVEYGFHRRWNVVVGDQKIIRQVYLDVKNRIDTYYAGRPFEVTVEAGIVRGQRARGE